MILMVLMLADLTNKDLILWGIILGFIAVCWIALVWAITK